ncbi:unnamed protein product [Vitrella brassicaformis CCMP3155]|uniref:CHRD domain-containing protein n=1 Tax=Vitrella brassicaformis (strain CCMP3155) TaxID=1169540 RepID=A0A0G4EUA8_VITBC|nr:unnamed protein product [Vitrella brassicaformis CCMP3155]|eukprot:CEM01675.1 unnamed protein product [Vitrella brassicaformis CCMP3155]
MERLCVAVLIALSSACVATAGEKPDLPFPLQWLAPEKDVKDQLAAKSGVQEQDPPSKINVPFEFECLPEFEQPIPSETNATGLFRFVFTGKELILDLILNDIVDVIGVHFHLCTEGELTGTPTAAGADDSSAPCTGDVVGFILPLNFRNFDGALSDVGLTGVPNSGNAPLKPGEPVILNGVVVRDGIFDGDDLVNALEGEELSALIAAIAAEQVYVNIHTLENMPGEIRCNLVEPDSGWIQVE